ncbi:MAG TPA: metalloregulator ArsR/SmtB family transcription factor [Candidatus Bathyarchaeia archaeon]|nr:metalloregulator ArsR/SmtB family transcription factor [Candidatus Bathyarchaeia archaeon]
MSLNLENKKSLKAKFFKALADPIRLQIIDFLADGEKCVCEIVEQLNLIQPLISRHLRILRESGMVIDRRDGTKKLYKLSNIKIKEIIDLLDQNLLNDLFQKIILEAL